MYQSHWGLDEMPFSGCIDPKRFYSSPTHEEALARLHFLVENHRRLGLLFGQSGSGKTLLLEVFAEQLRRSGQAVAKVNLLGLDSLELLWQLAVGLGLNPSPTASQSVLWRNVTDRLLEHRFRQLETAILLDNADQAVRGVPQQLARLAQNDLSSDARLTIILAVANSDVSHLGERLLDLADLRIDLEAWEVEDVGEFLHFSLTNAGGDANIFSDEAVSRLHELTGGVPRRVIQLADLALMAGAGAEHDRIDAEVVTSAHHELGAVEV
jgi:type II secretory pathway predicted ATPase ExeA